MVGGYWISRIEDINEHTDCRSVILILLIDIPETKTGKRWEGQRVELQVSMSLWKLWPTNVYRKKKGDRRMEVNLCHLLLNLNLQ